MRFAAQSLPLQGIPFAQGVRRLRQEKQITMPLQRVCAIHASMNGRFPERGIAKKNNGHIEDVPCRKIEKSVPTMILSRKREIICTAGGVTSFPAQAIIPSLYAQATPWEARDEGQA